MGRVMGLNMLRSPHTLSLQFKELTPTLGKVDVRDSAKYFQRLADLSFAGCDIHCDGCAIGLLIFLLRWIVVCVGCGVRWEVLLFRSSNSVYAFNCLVDRYTHDPELIAEFRSKFGNDS